MGAIEFETTCVNLDILQMEKMMKGKKEFLYERACALIQEHCPKIYNDLSLQFWNPYENETYQTKKTHHHYS